MVSIIGNLSISYRCSIFCISIPASYRNFIDVAGNLTISGTTESITGYHGISCDGNITISGATGALTITGTVGSNTADDIKGGLGDNPPINNGPQLIINGTSYNDWPAVKSWS